VAFVDERLLAPLQGPARLGTETRPNKRRAIRGRQLTVEPGHAVGVDLRFEVDVGKQAERHPPASLGVIISGAGLEVAGDAPMVGVDPLDDPGPP
jgi:hypothetical protein